MIKKILGYIYGKIHLSGRIMKIKVRIKNGLIGIINFIIILSIREYIILGDEWKESLSGKLT